MKPVWPVCVCALTMLQKTKKHKVGLINFCILLVPNISNRITGFIYNKIKFNADFYGIINEFSKMWLFFVKIS